MTNEKAAFAAIRECRMMMTRQEYKTLWGQVKAGDTDGAMRGLKKLKERKRAKQPSPFVAWSEKLTNEKHKWEVMTPVNAGGLRLRSVTFPPEEYDSAGEQWEDVLDYVRGCRHTGTEYYVFCDDRLVNF